MLDGAAKSVHCWAVAMIETPAVSSAKAPSPAPLQNAALLTRITQMRLPEAGESSPAQLVW